MARRFVSRRSDDDDDILSGWHKRRKGADRRRREMGEVGDGGLVAKLRSCALIIDGDRRDVYALFVDGCGGDDPKV